MTLGLNEESRDRGKEYAGRLHLLEKNEDRRQMGEIGFLGVSTSQIDRGSRSGRLVGSPSSRKIFMVKVGGRSVAQSRGKTN